MPVKKYTTFFSQKLRNSNFCLIATLPFSKLRHLNKYSNKYIKMQKSVFSRVEDSREGKEHARHFLRVSNAGRSSLNEKARRKKGRWTTTRRTIGNGRRRTRSPSDFDPRLRCGERKNATAANHARTSILGSPLQEDRECLANNAVVPVEKTNALNRFAKDVQSSLSFLESFSSSFPEKHFVPFFQRTFPILQTKKVEFEKIRVATLFVFLRLDFANFKFGLKHSVFHILQKCFLILLSSPSLSSGWVFLVKTFWNINMFF